MDKSAKDPYVYPSSHVLINKFHLRDELLLDEFEVIAFRRRYALGVPEGDLDYKHLKNIHHHLFQDIYDWAGQQRIVSISKGGNLFAVPSQITPYIQKVLEQLKNEHYLEKTHLREFTKRAAFYFGEINAAHPFRERGVTWGLRRRFICLT